LCALRDDPVSVNSTIASASSGTFTSVAPHENSTVASIPFSFKYTPLARKLLKRKENSSWLFY